MAGRGGGPPLLNLSADTVFHPDHPDGSLEGRAVALDGFERPAVSKGSGPNGREKRGR
ncbi:hypothetical protein SCATT_p10870 (plasmid) [Streptantibioticus cattleyicolor NRRL 8057 = DSM 46488]|uniref:Uncharacterized protein n=1 Tax=Streptantibioticus cattleyicolor (strain ATCC 35852 / DSM 46488 / JCM 4925 / NBRC 14057 / NRRL 8057) TaxID=1003195 RepID=G8XEC6_STREN|nr:hypothetical protein SCATT_p10870 [Streptantibioticus cattleyicolor NRRL 8057 = DSM 46488]